MSLISLNSVHEPEMAATSWRRSSFCYSGECVEVTASDGVILVRDSKQPGGAIQRYSADEWRSFVRAVKSGALSFTL